MPKFKMIPAIDAGDLPSDVEKELMNWNEELCFHGDGGCVFYLDGDNLERLPLFTSWMLSIGAWTMEDIKLPSYKLFAQEHNLLDSPRDYAAYYKWCNGRQQYLKVAMTGT
mgnify:CR=1 FL=1